MEVSEPQPSLPMQMQRKLRFTSACVLSVIVLFSAYSNHFHNAFHFDDSHVIVENLYIRSLNNIPTFFLDASTSSRLPTNADYRPLLSTTYAIDYWLSGKMDPWQFHVTQFMFLLLLGTGLVFLFRRLMDQAAVHWWNQYAALFVALLFCLHTGNSETINYISTRSDLLSTLFVVLAFLVYLYFPTMRRFHLYLIPMILGALVKVSAVMFAPILLAYILFFEQNLSLSDLFSSSSWTKVRTALGRTAPAFVVGIFMFWLIDAMQLPTQSHGGGPRFQYLITQPFVWLDYVRIFFLPLGLTVDSDWKLLSAWYDTKVFAGLALIAFMVYGIWRFSKTQSFRLVAFGIVWFGMALLPTSSLFPLAEVTNGHRTFFPYIGLTFAVVWWLGLKMHTWFAASTESSRWATPMIVAMGLFVLGGHAVGTYERNKVWHSSETLWQDVVEKSPENGRGLMNYGLTKMAKGEYSQANDLFKRAQIYTPNYTALEINLGIVTDRLGDQQQAEEHFLRALRLNPDYVEGNYLYARWLVEQGRSNSAIPHLKHAIALSPAAPNARTLLMRLYAAKGERTDLKKLAEDTLVISPVDTSAKAFIKGEIPIEVNPKTAEGYYKRGLTFTFSKPGKYLDAVLLYRQALQVDPNPGDPDPADIYNNLGWSLANLGFYKEAIPAFEQAISIRPGYQLAKNNLAWAKKQLENGK